ncbi:TonB-dependent receptor [Dyella sedimenti]|uniref:TonB-dependent receptor n=1 Tax=Dyella sedimenti TaxID=2919947 RepID=UPI001FA9A9C3|nr:TonB-dependent receptor [Dyella sedimenti]
MSPIPVPAVPPRTGSHLRPPYRRTSLALCLAALLAAPGAWAQDAVTLSPIAVQGVVQDSRVDNPGQVADLGKTGTALGDLPASVQVIPRALMAEQGASMLRDVIGNASGINAGGQDAKGYFDHFLIRGLNAQIYSDGFSDGDQLSGLSHSLNGVERVEILEGPGSALFGSGAPGGTINIVHYAPVSTFHAGASLQAGSFGSVTGSGYATGPTGVAGLDYRVDATLSHADGFRDLGSRDKEIRPALRWRWGDHVTDFALDARNIHETPDSYGIIYFDGTPLRDVSRDAKYSSPFTTAHSDVVRPTLADAWTVSDLLTVNNRLSYLHRTLDAVVNGDSSSTKVSDGEVVNRQLRRQDDRDNSLDYQLEPVWHFATGSVRHTLLTGFEYQRQTLSTQRATADLPAIPDAFAPVPPETSLAGVNFLCDAKHSCDDDRLAATYYGLYATDQADVTDALKLRAGVRQDWWDTSLTPRITVPGRFGTDGRPLLGGVKDTRDDAPLSWNVGALYKLFAWMLPYVGVSSSHLANFNSENTQNGVGAPESARQYEAGIKFAWLDGRIVLDTAAFDVKRDHVAAATTIDGVEAVVFDSQKTRGTEASLDAALTGQWHLLANLTHQDAVITDNPQGIASVGHRPQGAPGFLGNLWTTYRFAIAGLPGFRVGGGVNYQGHSYSDLTNANGIPSAVVLNALLGYQAASWGVDLNLRNLANRRYFVAANGAGAFVGEARSAFVGVHADF